MIVNFSLKVAEAKVPVAGNLEHAPVVTGLDISVCTEIKAEEFTAYAEMVKGQMAAIVGMIEKRQTLDLS